MTLRKLITISAIACHAAACGSDGNGDLGVDGSASGADASLASDGGRADAGSAGDGGVESTASLALDWVRTITSEGSFSLYSARLAPLPGDGVAVSVGLTGTASTFEGGAAESVTVEADDGYNFIPAAGWYDANGDLIRARLLAVHQMRNDVGLSAGVGAVASSPDGAVFFGGRFAGAAVFGPGDPGATMLVTDFQQEGNSFYIMKDAVLSRYGADGSIDWVTRAKGTLIQPNSGAQTWSSISDLVITGTGEAMSAGWYSQGAVIFGQGEAGETTLGSGPDLFDSQSFVARFAADRQLVWARRIRGGRNYAEHLVEHGSGSVAVVGNYRGSVVLGEGEAGETTLSSTGLEAGFVGSYAADGTLAWARSLVPTTAESRAYPVDIAAINGGLWTLGYADGPFTVPADGSTEYDPSDRTLVLARFSDDGDLVRVVLLGGSDTYPFAIASGDNGEVWVAARVGPGGATFAPESGSALEVPAMAEQDRAVLLRVSAEGALLSARLVATGESVEIHDLIRSPAGDMWLSGRYYANTVLEPGTDAEQMLSNPLAPYDLFLAKYRSLAVAEQ